MMQGLSKFALIWRRRSFRDALMVAVICLIAYGGAHWFELFDRAYELAIQYRDYELDDLMVVSVVFGLLMAVYTLRRAHDLKLEIKKRELAEKKIDEHAMQLAMAVNNIPQGIVMYDSHERLLVSNQHYLQMYKLSAEIVKPGAPLIDVFRHRADVGLLDRDPEEYRTELLTLLAKKEVVRRIVKTSDGREIAITDYPMVDGGWVATHEDRTELQRREESFRLLFENNPVAMWLFDRKTLRFVAVNESALECYGYSRAQFLSMKVTETRPGDPATNEARLRNLPEIQNELVAGVNLRADGTTFPVAICSRVMNYEGREVRLAAISDMTARESAEDDLRRTKIFLDTIIESVPLPILVKRTQDNCFTLANKASEELFGFKREDIIGKTPHALFGKERADLIQAQDSECLAADNPVVIRDRYIPTPRGPRLITAKKLVIPGHNTKAEYILTLLDDVTDARQVQERIAHMAHSDPLTDLPNRAAFNERLSSALKSAEAERRSFAILCMDLDGFKEVNDIYGHAVGDSLLCQIADRLRAAADGVFVARLGGDEFTMIVTNAERSSLDRYIKRLLEAFVEDFEIEGHRLSQALSIGVAIYPDDGTDSKTLMSNADAALYRAKAADSGAVQFFEAAMGARLRDRVALQADLRFAIPRNELCLHYQPQLTMAGEVVGFEALARWKSPTRGMVPPSEFILMAEESSLILRLGEWVMREACREAATWDKPLKIAINVSPVQFRHGDLARMVHLILIESGLAPGRLELEVTEGVLVDDFPRALSVLRRLKSLGLHIAMDDFGKGYSSLSYLRAFPYDKIKIDRSFISDLEINQQSVAIVRSVIGLGRNLNIPILAEGVETRAQHDFLTCEGCNEVQGYLTGRPRPIEDYAEVIGRKTLAVANAG